MQKLSCVIKNLRQVSVMFRVDENVHCQWAHLSSKALLKCWALPESWLLSSNSTWWMQGISGSRKGDCIQATRETSWVLLGFQQWKRGKVSASNSICLTLHYDKVSDLPADSPKLSSSETLSALLWCYHCRSSRHQYSVALQNLCTGKCS